MSKLLACFVALGVVLGGAAARAESLFVYAGAGLRPALQKLADQFQQDTGVEVLIEYGGMGQLLPRLEASKRGDVMVSGARFYTDDLEKKGLIRDVRSLVYHTAVVGVAKAKAGEITRFEDLARPGVRLALGDPQAMALGRSAEEILKASGLEEALRANVVTRATTVQQLGLYVTKGDVDAAILSRPVVVQSNGDIVPVEIPLAWYTPEEVTIGVLTTTENPTRAQAFVDFVTSVPGLAAFTAAGFAPVGQ
ncbi:molybdate ABC transporter substrate-binding protein [Pararhodospirillum photometricum]|uniref:Molybdenum ABC-transporter, periplasmic substrate-binding protein n=1 Tax=Pararhodospirillum photometricum DSM 122 TaxID=1150469 RepID=H6SL90_PARPM|nr:molybdate ABC transporter substrate-binding protein [Pararhodospirillum photometricum]CCG08755.1 Molybdenum ABC-transporter, periplasmic substrate-binding protein [Pararhodospirillum photometricum DSM 122]